MKRYWKSIVIILFFIITMGGFYIYMALSEPNVPNFVIKKVSGDEREIDGLKINSTYNIGDTYWSIRIEKDKTIHDHSRGSIVNSLTRTRYEPEINHLMNDYKNFLRRKYLYSQYFYENDQFLAYVNIKRKNDLNFLSYPDHFIIDVLDKKSEERQSYTLPVPDGKNHYFLDVEDIKMVDGDLKIITEGQKEGDKSVEYKVYTINLKNKRIVNENVIASIPSIENGGYTDYFLTVREELDGGPHVMIKIEMHYYHADNEYMEEENHSSQVVFYDLEKERSEELNIPDEILSSTESVTVIDSMLYLQLVSEKGIEVYPYDLKTNKVGKSMVFPTEKSNNGDDSQPFIKMASGKIYIVKAHDTKDSELKVLIADLKSGKTLFEGIVQAENKNENVNYHLFINDIEKY